MVDSSNEHLPECLLKRLYCSILCRGIEYPEFQHGIPQYGIPQVPCYKLETPQFPSTSTTVHCSLSSYHWTLYGSSRRDHGYVNFIHIHKCYTVTVETCYISPRMLLLSLVILEEVTDLLAGKHSKLLGFGTLSIVRNSKYWKTQRFGTVFVSIFRCGEGDPYSVGSLRKS
jgi:hypothetical protein